MDGQFWNRYTETLPREKLDARLSGEAVGDGRLLGSRQALEHGLIDQVGYFEEAAAAARDLSGEEEVRVVRYEARVSLYSLLMSNVGEDGGARHVEIRVPGLSHVLKPGIPYYAYPGWF